MVRITQDDSPEKGPTPFHANLQRRPVMKDKIFLTIAALIFVFVMSIVIELVLGHRIAYAFKHHFQRR